MPTVCLKWHPYSSFSMNFLYFANVNGYIGLMDTESMDKRVLIEEADEIACIDFSLDGACLASVGKDAQIKLYDSNLNSSSRLNQLICTYGESRTTTGGDVSSHGFRSSSVLDMIDNESTQESSATHTNRLQAVKFSNTSSFLLFTGGWDRCVKIWDRRSARGYVSQLNGPFICGSDAIDVNVRTITCCFVFKRFIPSYNCKLVEFINDN